MEIAAKFRGLFVLLFLAANIQTLSAQTKADIFDENVPVTWLGVDYSQTKFIRSAAKDKATDAGMASNNLFRLRYTVDWNQLFITEKKKYNVATAVHRKSVKYAIEVAAKANLALEKKDFFSENPSDFKTLTEANIADVVKNYDFGNNEGIGLIFFVEGMSKDLDSMGIWVTFVDMKSKSVLLTRYGTGRPYGFGVRNYWANPLFTVLKSMGFEFNKWKKE